MVAQDLTNIAQFGFAALAAAALWQFIRTLVPNLLTIIKQNSEAMTRSADALNTVTVLQKDVISSQLHVENRLASIEAALRTGERCPLGVRCPLGEKSEQGK